MSTEIDRRKCGSEYSLCKRCKHEDEYGSERCRYCTRVVDIGYSMILCGIPIGSGISWLHQNFEDKDAKGGAKNEQRRF